MRANIIRILVGLLIAMFAIGESAPARADCRACDGCPIEAPAKKDAPCQDKALACQVAPTCVNQTQKAPAQLSHHSMMDAGEAAFGLSSSIAIKSAYHTPETAPPRA